MVVEITQIYIFRLDKMLQNHNIHRKNKINRVSTWLVGTYHVWMTGNHSLCSFQVCESLVLKVKLEQKSLSTEFVDEIA